jgi:hypothetical protein
LIESKGIYLCVGLVQNENDLIQQIGSYTKTVLQLGVGGMPSVRY